MRPTRAILLFFFVFAPVFFLFGNNQQNQIVYVTATGQAYHLDGCTSLQRTQFAVSLIDAVKSGFRPCSRCRPPTISNPASIQRNTTPLYRVNVEGLTHSSAADVRRMLRADKQCADKKPRSFVNYFFKIFFEQRYVELYKEVSKPPPKPVIKVVQCPVCKTEFSLDACPCCGLKVLSINDAFEIEKHKKLYFMPEEQKKAYIAELEVIYSKELGFAMELR